jgi:hypothetical protein
MVEHGYQGGKQLDGQMKFIVIQILSGPETWDKCGDLHNKGKKMLQK